MGVNYCYKHPETFKKNLGEGGSLILRYGRKKPQVIRPAVSVL